jgi:hypothetical protein
VDFKIYSPPHDIAEGVRQIPVLLAAWEAAIAAAERKQDVE